MKKIILFVLTFCIFCSFVYADLNTDLAWALTMEGDCTDATGQTTWTEGGALADVTGVNGSALENENDAGDYCVNTNNNIGGLSDRTIAWWINVTNADANDMMMSTTSGNIQVYYRSGEDRFTFYIGGHTYFYTGEASIRNKFHHVLATTNSSGFYLFVDGVLNVSSATTTFTGSTADDIWFFVYGPGGPSLPLAAGMDEIYSWNRSLDADEIAQLNAGDATSYYPFPSAGASAAETDIIVANNTFDSNYAINFTSDGGQACGFNTTGEWTLCGPTEDQTPTIRFSPVTGSASFRLYEFTGTFYNFTSLGTSTYNYTNCTSGTYYSCTVGWNLTEGIKNMVITGFSDPYFQATKESYLSNQFNISIDLPDGTIGLDLITPTIGNINYTYHGWSSIVVNVSCHGEDCGEINVSFDPFIVEETIVDDRNLFEKIWDWVNGKK